MITCLCCFSPVVGSDIEVRLVLHSNSPLGLTTLEDRKPLGMQSAQCQPSAYGQWQLSTVLEVSHNNKASLLQLIGFV